MTHRNVFRSLAAAVLAAASVLTTAGPASADVSFTYQGRLTGTSGPVDIRATLYDAASNGTLIAGPTITSGVALDSTGLFTTALRFNAADLSGDRWVQIEIAPTGTNSFTTLSPSQWLSPTPKASYAATAATVPWSGITGVPAQVASPFAPWSPLNGGIAYTGGSVGIGTTAPVRSLQLGDFNAPFESMIRFVSVSQDQQGYRGWDVGVPIADLPQPGAAFSFVISDGINGNPLTNPAFMIKWGSGNVGIGTTAPDQKLTVNGNASKPGGGTWAVFSDPRLKHDITPLSGTLDRLLDLHGYSFLYNDEEVKSGRCLPGRQIGLMADEVERVFPDWVSRDSRGMRAVTERSTTALMVEALRDLRAETSSATSHTQRRIDSLTAENADLRAHVARLEALLETHP